MRLEPVDWLGRTLDRARHRLGPWLAGRTEPILTERVVEYPWVFQTMPPPPARVLDFGAYEDLLPLHLAALGYEVVARDVRPYPFSHPRLQVDARDIFDGVEPRSFDVVVSVSTIEHVGLPGSGGREDAEGDRRCVELLLAGLRPGGLLVATVPFGAAATFPGFRVYDRERLRSVFPGATLRVFRKQGPLGSWSEAEPEEAEDVVTVPAYAPVEAIACLVRVVETS